MNTLEITLQRKIEGKWSVVVGRSASGSALPMRSEGELALNEADLQLLKQDAKAYGRMLGESLFRGTVRDAFMQARSEAESSVRVLLNVEDESLRLLRWERLCGPVGNVWDFLALNQRAPYRCIYQA